jgi:hypothetical protein
MTPPIQYNCLVCGTGSFRPFAEWINKFDTSIGPLVACDGHTKDEINEGLKRLKATLVSGTKETKSKAASATPTEE